MLTIEIPDTLLWEMHVNSPIWISRIKKQVILILLTIFEFFRLLNETFCKHKSCTKETAWTGKCPKLFSIGRLSHTNLNREIDMQKASCCSNIKHSQVFWHDWKVISLFICLIILFQWKLCSFMCWMVTALFPCSREHILRSQLRENCSSTTASMIVVSFKASVASWHTTCSKTFLKFKSSKPFNVPTIIQFLWWIQLIFQVTYGNIESDTIGQLGRRIGKKTQTQLPLMRLPGAVPNVAAEGCLKFLFVSGSSIEA